VETFLPKSGKIPRFKYLKCATISPLRKQNTNIITAPPTVLSLIYGPHPFLPAADTFPDRYGVIAGLKASDAILSTISITMIPFWQS